VYLDKSTVLVHRLSYEIFRGAIPEAHIVDHRCFNRLCFNPNHLRCITIAENNQHRFGASSNNRSSGVRNVYWYGYRKKWFAAIHHNGKQIRSEYFDDKEHACEEAVRLRALYFKDQGDSDMKAKHRRPRGTGAVFVDSQNRYTYTLELPNDPATGKRRRKTFRSKDPNKAKAKYLEARKKLISTGVLASDVTPKLADWLGRWLEEFKRPNVKPRVWESYRSDCRNITNSIGAVRIGDLTAAHVRKLEKDITSTRSSKTALNAYRRLSNALDDAVGEGLIEVNPCAHCDPPRVEANPTVILDAGQPVRLIQAASSASGEVKRRRGQNKWPDSPEDDAMWSLMWRLAFETGMRQGERFALTPADLVEVDGTPAIHVCHELQRYAKGAVIPSWLKAEPITKGIWMVPPKSKKGERIVPVSKTLWDDLAGWATDHELTSKDLIFTRKGQPLTNTVERRRWYRALEKAGLPRVTIRSARHYFATQLAIAGASEDARKSIMGHVDIGTTAGYTHWSPQALAEITGKTALSIEQ
jgi:integrase